MVKYSYGNQSNASKESGMITCSCGKPNDDDALFCVWCGNALSSFAAGEASRDADVDGPAGASFCQHCGSGTPASKALNARLMPAPPEDEPEYLFSPAGEHWGVCPQMVSRKGTEIRELQLLSEEGGQGVVYRVNCGGRERALKIYRRALSENLRFRANLIENTKHDPPDESFIWPLDVVENIRAVDESGPFTTFGTVMELFPEGYVSVAALNKGKAAQFPDDYVRIRAILRVCTAFKKLHNCGLSYQDINTRNIIVHPGSGRIRIGDTDNIAPDSTAVFVDGTQRFMAPEIVRDRKNKKRCYTVNMHTDDYALAVLIFMLLFRAHPLEGKLFFLLRRKKEENALSDEDFNDCVYGYHPYYIFDDELHPEDCGGEKKRPCNGPLDNGQHSALLFMRGRLPRYVMDAFARSFSRGSLEGDSSAIQDRTMDAEWERIFLRLQAQYHRCPVCGRESFEKDDAGECWKCKKPLAQGKRIRLGNAVVHDYTVPAEGHRMIARSQFGPCSEDAKAEAMLWLTILQDGRTGVQNISGEELTLCFGEQERVLPPKAAVAALSGMKIKSTNGEVVFL